MQDQGFEMVDTFKPVVLKITNINRNGFIKVEFNQPLNVPGFLEQTWLLGQERRNLIEIEQLDLSRDIMEISLILNSEEDPELMQFSIELEAWYETGMNISYSFTNPLLVSTGIHPDFILCKVKERELFMAKEGNETLK